MFCLPKYSRFLRKNRERAFHRSLEQMGSLRTAGAELVLIFATVSPHHLVRFGGGVRPKAISSQIADQNQIPFSNITSCAGVMDSVCGRKLAIARTIETGRGTNGMVEKWTTSLRYAPAS